MCGSYYTHGIIINGAFACESVHVCVHLHESEDVVIVCVRVALLSCIIYKIILLRIEFCTRY